MVIKKFTKASVEKGALLMLGSSLFVALFGLFAKLGMQGSTLSIMVFFRFFIPFLLLIPYFIYKHSFHALAQEATIWMQVGRSLAVLVSQYSLFFYLTKASLINATMLWNTSPIFMPIISFLFFGERYNKWTWFSVLVGIIGVVCIIKPTGEIINPYAFFGILAGLAMSVSQVLYGQNSKTESIDVNLFYFFGFTSIFTLLILLIVEGVMKDRLEIDLLPYFYSDWHVWIYACLIAVCTIGNQFLRGKAYKFSSPSTLGPIIYLSIIFSGIFDWVLFKETPDFLFVIGALLIILGVVFRRQSQPI